MTIPTPDKSGELKPCPFCGSGAAHHEIEDMDDPNFGGHFICCNVCGASTNLRFAGGDDPRPLLAEQWNRRPEPSSLVDDEDERGFTPSDYAHTAELLRSSEAIRKATASNNHNIILAALDICANRRSTDTRTEALEEAARTCDDLATDLDRQQSGTDPRTSLYPRLAAQELVAITLAKRIRSLKSNTPRRGGGGSGHAAGYGLPHPSRSATEGQGPAHSGAVRIRTSGPST